MSPSPQAAGGPGGPNGRAAAHVPGSTYRLQLRPGFGFAAVAGLLPYFEQLGATHLYLSPCLRALPGSTHGYDLVDHSSLNPDLGTREELLALAAGLADAGGGLVLDFVPNHMGVEDAPRNRWWWDVLENGQCSPYARYFDIDWDPVKPELRGRVLLPVLGDQYGRVLEAGELQLAYEDEALVLAYYERRYPVNPRKVPLVLRPGLDRLARVLPADHADHRELLSILTSMSNLPSRIETDPERVAERQREKEVARERLARLVARSPQVREHLDASLRRLNGERGRPESFRPLHELLEQQSYRLAYWRTAFHEINYRRFFDVNGLASVRMEEPEVFRQAHELLGRLFEERGFEGLRLDHVDGLHDPGGYLKQLVGALDEARGRRGLPRTYVVVEKVLSAGEALPDWPVHGTTGYEYLNESGGLQRDERGARELAAFYRRFTGRRQPFADIVYQGKKAVMEGALASEVNVLAHALNRISEGDPRSRDFTLNSLREMLVEVVACFPVYRTYVGAGGRGPFEERIVRAATAAARGRNPAMDPSIFDFFTDVVLGRPAGEAADDEDGARREFALKFQQYTGAVQAKGVEDTAFYRYHPLLSLNEVGGDPRRLATSPADFHALNRARLERWPNAMLCTSTHDTKRGEDVRARLNALTEVPAEWAAAVSQWARLNSAGRTRLPDGWAPDRNDEYLFYQTLVGAWPAGTCDPGAFGRRIEAYMMKAIREAKEHTSWVHENRPYEQAVASFVEQALTGRRSAAFLESFMPLQRRVAAAGVTNSLAQVVLKIALPGVPDFYQGSECWDLSLVDPDNRRPVDFEARRAMMGRQAPLLDDATPVAEREAGIAALLADWTEGGIKLLVTAACLRVRRAHDDLFRRGLYRPLEARGAHARHAFAFARGLGESAVIAVVPRLALGLPGGGFPTGEAWEDTALELPAHLAELSWRNVLTGDRIAPGGHGALALARALRACPVALLAGTARAGG